MNKNKKRLVFRFDIDTELCIKRGVPALMSVAARHGVAFTFFCNMGRAVSRRHFIAKLLRNRRRADRAVSPVHLSAFTKLGPWHYLRTALVNPRVGACYPAIATSAAQAGHEVGLHGGHNHAVWADELPRMSESAIRSDIEWALEQMSVAGLDRPLGFASPEWVTHAALPRILRSLGFKYIADRHGSAEDGVDARGELPDLPTNLVGEPGGVGWFEYQRAVGRTDAQMLAKFERELASERRFLVMYDHPYYAGLRETRLLSKFIEVAKGNEIPIVCMNQLLTIP